MGKYKFTNIDGPDLRGKTTQCKLLAQALDAHYEKFPNYDSITGQLIRGALTNSNLTLDRTLYGECNNSPVDILETQMVSGVYKKDSYHFQCINMMSRLERQNAIRSILETRHIVCDRYDTPALVYGSTDGCRIEWIENLLEPLIKPDINIIIMGPAFSRDDIPDCNETDKEFVEKIELAYYNLAPKYGWKIIHTVTHVNGELLSPEDSINITHQKILEYVNSIL